MSDIVRRYLFLNQPVFSPAVPYGEPDGRAAKRIRRLSFVFCLCASFGLALAARCLELPFWDNPAYSLNGEHLLATHDAYHWIAGAEGFEFGMDHPMAGLAGLVARCTGLAPAQVGFWLPPVMSALLAVAVFFWAAAFGQPFAGLCAGMLASLAPSFFARTLLGFYDTDLVVLFFAVLFGLIPALWLAPWLRSPLQLLLPRVYGAAADTGRREARLERAYPAAVPEGGPGGQPDTALRTLYSPCWLSLLLLAGLFCHWTQVWHSFFHYLVPYAALLLPALIAFFGPATGRRLLLAGALTYVFPLAVGGLRGALAGFCWMLLLLRARPSGRNAGKAYWPEAAAGEKASPSRRVLQCVRNPFVLGTLWLTALFLSLDSSVLEAMQQSFASYADRSGDMSSLATDAADPLVFPSVAQSIIEVQIISLQQLLVYLYPIEILSAAAFALTALRLLLSPVLASFVPLYALCLLSLSMGARMTMFGAPVCMLVLCMDVGRVLDASVSRLFEGRAGEKNGGTIRTRSIAARAVAGAVCSFLAVGGLAWPLVRHLPDYTQGPIISREHAEALSFIKEHSTSDSVVWNWWDWGYATHHFARRATIADGARHGGPSLYLPAAVYTTADARFARQLIKYTAFKGNTPGLVFEGMGAGDAQRLMRELGDRRRPLIQAEGRQYIVASLELLRIGLWVTRYGSWNFESRQSSGSLMNNLSAALQLNVDTGEVLAEGAEPVYAAGFVFFDGKGIERFTYNRYGAYHFLFNTQQPERRQEGADGLLRRFWLRERGSGVFATLVSDKMAMDDVFFNTMMVQLLVCPPEDPAIAPYFRLVFDNTYARVYEVL